MIDLHTHSNCSDGSDDPEQLVELAKQAGLTAFALTDHDNVEGLSRAAKRASEVGVTFIPGLELSCHTPQRNVHLLAYLFDPTDATLATALAGQRRLRAERNSQLLTALRELEYEITMDEVLRVAGDATMGRPHFAKVLVDKGYFDSISQTFLELLGEGRPGYVSRQEFEAKSAIEMIHNCGGLAVWAHPIRNRDSSDLYPALDWLTESGLDGVETYYSLFTPEQRQLVKRAAKSRGLVPTGGSDYHGSYKPELSLGTGPGNLSVPDETIDQLIGKHQQLFGK